MLYSRIYMPLIWFVMGVNENKLLSMSSRRKAICKVGFPQLGCSFLLGRIAWEDIYKNLRRFHLYLRITDLQGDLIENGLFSTLNITISPVLNFFYFVIKVSCASYSIYDLNSRHEMLMAQNFHCAICNISYVFFIVFIVFFGILYLYSKMIGNAFCVFCKNVTLNNSGSHYHPWHLCYT